MAHSVGIWIMLIDFEILRRIGEKYALLLWNFRLEFGLTLQKYSEYSSSFSIKVWVWRSNGIALMLPTALC